MFTPNLWKEFGKYIVFGFLPLLLIFQAGCGDGGGESSNSGSEVLASATIGTGGGIVTTSNGKVALNIPAGALNNDTTISIQQSDTQDMGDIGTDTGYHFGPSGLTFNKSITLTLNYDSSTLPVGVSEEDIRLAILTEDGWDLIENSTVDTTNHQISGEFTHFSTYGLQPINFYPEGLVKESDFSNTATKFGMPIGGNPNKNENLSGNLSLLSIRTYSQGYPKIRFNDDGDTSGDENEWYVTTAFNREYWITNIWHESGTPSWYCPARMCSSTNYAYHPGEDWNLTTGGATDKGRPIYAIANGIVIFNGWLWGNTVILAHRLPNGEYIASVYAHISNPSDKVYGSKVAAGDVIGNIGATGSGSYHLHFEIAKGIGVDGTTYMLEKTTNNEIKFKYETTYTDGKTNKKAYKRFWKWPGKDSTFIGNNWYDPSSFIVEHSFILSVSLPDGSTNVPVDTTISATVKKDIDAPSSMSDNNLFVVRDPNGNAVAGELSGNVYTNTFTFIPSSSLSFNTRYTVTISTSLVDLSGNHMPSNYTWSFTTIQATNTLPSAPIGLTAAGGDGQVTISWDAVSSATSYNLYMASQSGVTKNNYAGLLDGMKHTGVISPYTHTGLSNGTTYYFVVTAVNTYGESTDSSEVSATPSASTTWTGTKQLGTVGDDKAGGIAVDSNGNVYITGYTYGDMDGNIDVGVTSNIFLVKYNSSGIKQWTRQLGSMWSDYATGVAVDSTGNIYVTGYTYGDLDGNTNMGAGTDFFLVKYDPSGVKQWTRQHGTTVDDMAAGVAVDSSGNIYVTGYTYGGLDGNTNAGKYDIFLAKYDPAGVKQWVRQLGTGWDDKATGVAVDSNGNIYVTGYTEGALEEGSTNAAYPDIFLVKYDPSGIKQWIRQRGSWSTIEKATGIAIDINGNVYIAGQKDSDIVLYKYNPSGVSQWVKVTGTPYDDYASGVGVDNSGNVYITGRTNRYSLTYDRLLVKYDPSGSEQWFSIHESAKSADYAIGIAVDSIRGNVYVTGHTLGDLDGNTSAGGYDVFITKYNMEGGFL